jgi:probable rRNA maturation factor
MVQDRTIDKEPAGGAEPADPRASACAAVDVNDSTGRLGKRADWLSAKAAEAARALTLTGEIRVRVLDDAAMSAAHERWKGVAGTTDVLTFDYSGEAPARNRHELDADVLVCLDEAERQASQRGHPPERELLLYVVHAMLHALGMDDHDEAAAARMHAREDEVLQQIGVGATYRAGSQRPGGPEGGCP